jgi:D-alanyl-D-alanine carboxypeptidase (penicillin-binding protein 5/6)
MKDIRHEVRLDEPVKAPVKAGQKIGKVVVYQGANVLAEFDLEAPRNVGRANWWTLLKRTCAELFT